VNADFSNLSPSELTRYSRHILLPQFGLQAQEKLKQAHVLVIGAGGLGCPLLSYLTAAGVGKIGIVDFDVVDESNLQRQVPFTVADVGLPKAQVAARRLKALNPHTEFEIHRLYLSSANAMDILCRYDVVADGTDNFPTRYLTNDACVLLRKPLVYGSIFQFDGQISVFNWTHADGTIGPNYRDLYPTPPEPGSVPSCAEAGVLGVLPGIVGSIQASEVIKIIAGIGEPLSGRLLIFEALKFDARVLRFGRDPDNPLNGTHPTLTGLIDYEDFCGLKPPVKDWNGVPDITAQELKKMMDCKEPFQLVDVREHFEYGIVNLGGELIPLGSLDKSIDRISRDRLVVIHCKIGSRSAQAVQRLREKGYANVMNLKGGILAYIDEIDPSMPRY
jgi:adenylyltransferase/sulfurtransferase